MEPRPRSSPAAQQEHDAAGSTVNEPIRFFAALSRADVAYGGGKGANLGELTAAGLPVPGGFVVGAPAYAAFCDAGGLRGRIEERLDEVDVDDTEALDAAAGRRARRWSRPSRSPRWSSRRSAPPTPSSPATTRRRTGGGALVGDRRGHRGGLVRGHERDLPQRPRRRRGGRRRAPLLVVAVRRPHRLLPRQARLRPGRHGHRRRRPAPGAGHARRA